MLKPIQRKPERLEFVDPNQEQPWVLFLRQPDDLELGYANDVLEELASQYITGGWFDANKSYKEKPDLLSDDSGNPVIVSRDQLFYVTRLQVMQDAPTDDDEFTAQELLCLIPFYPVAWQAIKAKMLELLQLPKGQKDKKKGDTPD